MPVPSARLRYSVGEPTCGSPDRAWTIVVADDDDGGRGAGAAASAYLRGGEVRSPLEQTLDRLGQLTPASRLLSVVGERHLDTARAQLRGRADHVLSQPLARDSAFGLFVALAMVRRWAPRAVVTVTPVPNRLPMARTGIAHLSVARRLAALLADQVIIIGGNPPAHERELPCVPAVAGLPQVGRVRGVVEEAPGARGWQLEHEGVPWCIAGACATIGAWWELGRVTCPRLMDTLESLVPLVGTADEGDAIDYIYRANRPVSFARDVVARAPWRCVSMPIDGSPTRWETVLDPARGARPRRSLPELPR